jgi:integrase/recombinase XerD
MNPIYHAIDAYFNAAGLAPESVRKYRDLLWKFADTVDQLELDQIERHHCRAFLGQWATKSESTQALYVTVLRRFFAFLVTEELIDRSPMDGVARPRRKRPEDLDVVTVTDSDVQRLIAACDTWQEFLCISILVYLGVRRRAASKLRRRDMDLGSEPGTIRFKEKGGKIITKPIPAELLVILKAAEEEGIWLEPSDYVIPNRQPAKNKERSHKVIYDTVKKVAERARVTTHVHALRAAFAVRFDDQHPREVIALKELLGHSRLETALVYLRRKDRARAMESVVDLTWSVLPPSPLMPPAGFEPALPEPGVPKPLQRKLDELSAGSRRRSRST